MLIDKIRKLSPRNTFQYWVLLVGLLSFFRFTGIVNIFSPSKGSKIFSSNALTKDYDFKNLRSLVKDYKEPLIIENKTNGSKNKMRFVLYPHEVISHYKPRKKPNAFFELKQAQENNENNENIIAENASYQIRIISN